LVVVGGLAVVGALVVGAGDGVGATSITNLSIAASPRQLHPRVYTKFTTGDLPAKGERSTEAVCHLFPWSPLFLKTLAGLPPLGVTVTSSVPMLLPYMWNANVSERRLPANGCEASTALCPVLRGHDVSQYM